jgi:hypothetical protein
VENGASIVERQRQCQLPTPKKTCVDAAVTDRASTCRISQVWYYAETLAIICDRLVHNAHMLSLKGPSIRQRKALKKSAEETTTTT